MIKLKKKDFMKQVAEHNMPDFSEVRENCINQLNQKNTLNSHNFRIATAIVAITLVVGICISPVNSFADNLLQQIQTYLNLNGNKVEVGQVSKSNIHIPEDCEKAEYNDKTYLSKCYPTLSDLTEDIQSDFYVWMKENQFQENGIILNVIPDDYARITLLYDVNKENVNLTDLAMYVYFPLSSDSAFEDIKLENEQLKYATIDDEGNIKDYEQNTQYKMIEQYTSYNLGTAVTVISSVTSTAESENTGEFEDSTVYYLYFTVDGVCYQINCVGTLDEAHEVIENLQITDSIAKSDDVPMEESSPIDSKGNEWIRI